eukprot:Skav211707  [mRNA]  locus=scaffold2852:13650:23301:- [translate_table: standard]
MEASTLLNLEIPFHTLSAGSRTDVLAHIQCSIPETSVCTSVVYKQPFVTNARISPDKPMVAILNGIIGSMHGQTWILCDETTTVIQHEIPNHEAFDRIIEGCSGIGVVGQGFQASGMRTVAYIDSNQKFCQFIANRSETPVIHGDMSDPRTIAEVAKVLDGKSHSMSAGIACQPFSSLGDQKMEHDHRSTSLIGTLRMCFFLRTTAVFLECTKEAATSQWVQAVLREYHMCTNFSVCQKVLPLHVLWPAKRDRWWCVLLHPAFPMADIPDMPELRFHPGVCHVIPRTLHLEPAESQELELDDFEVAQFNNHRGGIPSYILDTTKCLPTATHSWGSQASACACGCRQSGFRADRLATKGLHGVLTLAYKQTDPHLPPPVRHLAAQEVAMLHGAAPSRYAPEATTEVRLALAGTGQLASPLQAVWVASNVKYKASQFFPTVQSVHPRHAIATMCRITLEDRARWWPDSTPLTRIFVEELQSLDHPRIFPRNRDDQEDDAMSSRPNDQPTQGQTNPVSTEAQVALCPTGGVTGFETQKRKADHLSQAWMPTPAHQQPTEIATTKITTTAPARSEPPECKQTTVSHQTSEKEQSNAITTESSSDAAVTNQPEEPSLTPPEGPPAVMRENAMPIAANATPAPSPVGESPLRTPAVHAEPTIAESKGNRGQRAEISHHNLKCILIRQGAAPVAVAVPKGTTVGQIATAEWKFAEKSNMCKAVSLVGSMVPLNAEVHDNQVLYLLPCDVPTPAGCASHNRLQVPNVASMSRAEAIWHQRGWVAQDELNYYLQTIGTDTNVEVTPPIIVPSDAETRSNVIDNWLGDMMEQSSKASTSLIAHTIFWYNHHWFPVKAEFSHDTMTVTTTPDMSQVVQAWISESTGTMIEVNAVPVRSVFPADCGFQAVAWLRCVAQNQPVVPMEVEEAIQLRQRFMQAIEHHQDVPANTLILGGANNDQLKQALQALVEQHGVSKDRSAQCVQHMITHIGSQPLQKALGTNRPWPEVKTLATQCSPPIKIVLTSELQQAIANRVKTGKPFGRKESKLPSKPAATPVSIRAEQIHIPDAVFQSEGVPVAHLEAQQAHSNCQGIMVMNPEEAKPYLDMKQPLSQRAVAMVVLNFQNLQTQKPHEIIKFPATYVDTSEPILVTGAMFQLGMKPVGRNIPSQCQRIEEEEMVVIRAQVFKDQTAFTWSDFVQHPVRELMTEPEFAAAEGKVHDVWDRQFVSLKYQKCRPQESEVFIVTLRIAAAHVPTVMQANATNGKYYEPRVPSGRQSSPDFEVIWVPRHFAWDHCRLTPPKEVWWGWAARPGQPMGQDQDHSGIFWTAVSHELPTHWVYRLDHGDIIISKLASKEQRSNPKAVAVEASPLTMKHMVAKQKGQVTKEKGDDPWLQSDPWASPDRPPKQLTTMQLAHMEQAVQQRVLDSLQDRLPAKPDEDAEMSQATDSRVAELEQRVQAMQTNMTQMNQSMQSFQQQQTTHNQQVVQQINTVQQQVDTQQQGLQTLLNQKMDEQMTRIEAILNKRAKLGEPLAPTWSEDTWHEARLIANTFYLGTTWIHGATVYGYAHKASNLETKEKTDALIQQALYRVMHTMKGKRFLMGDFNQEDDGSLTAFATLRRHGWVEIQQWALQNYGRPIDKTCQETSTKDFVWVSPELIPYLRKVHTTNLFKDHLVLWAELDNITSEEPVHLWRKPKPFAWDKLPTPIPTQEWVPTEPNDAQKQVEQIAVEFESRVESQLRDQGKNLHPMQKGRSMTKDTVKVSPNQAPPRASRHGHARADFHGQSLRHTQWFKQLRRLESVCRPGLLHTCLNGTFFTADHAPHIQEGSEDKCPFCDQADSQTHRHWECPALEEARKLTDSMRATILSQPQATYNHGWIPAPRHMKEFCEALQNIPDHTAWHSLPPGPLEVLDLFTDGSCLDSKDSLSRIAAWAVVVATPHSAHEFHLASSGMVPGRLQTVNRAELLAAISAITLAHRLQTPYRLWVDNSLVYKTVRQTMCHNDAPKRYSNRLPNHDLRNQLSTLVFLTRSLCLVPVKVTSHQPQQWGAPWIDNWSARGNDAADQAAGRAFASFPEVLTVWQKLRQEIVELSQMRECLHTTLIEVGRLAQHKQTETQKQMQTSEATSDLAMPPASFEPWKFNMHQPALEPFICADTPDFTAWMEDLHEGSGPVQFWSWQQLFIDFRLRYPGKGPWYARERWNRMVWKEGESCTVTNFNKRAKWFRSWVTRMAAASETPLDPKFVRPSSHMFTYWTYCLPVRTTVERSEAVNAWLLQWLPVYKCQKDMRHIELLP